MLYTNGKGTYKTYVLQFLAWEATKYSGFPLILALLAVAELQEKTAAMFTAASLFICVCCSLSWTPSFINSVFAQSKEMLTPDLDMLKPTSVNSFQEVIIIAFPATLHLYNELSSEVLFSALECLPDCFLWV